MRVARVLLLILLIALLPLRAVIAAPWAGCGEFPSQAQAVPPDLAPRPGPGAETHGRCASPGKPCAPCCLSAAPPPRAVVMLPPALPAAPARPAAARRWVSHVPPLPDPPPRA